jgi:NAD(P)-dependent dehydrogenase (short-subunit alcohol dehydrogenase family)
MADPPTGRLCVVTGAASGVGLATTRQLRGYGTHVVAVDRAALPPEFGPDEGVEWIQGDVTSEETWERVGATCRARDPLGADRLIACAGDIVQGSFLDTSIDDWRRVMDINLFGVIHAMRTVMPGMTERGEGWIAVVCSVNSLYVEDQMSAYSTSKAAVLHAVRSAALEYASHGIRLNGVLPGYIDTPLLHRAIADADDPEGILQAARNRTPTGKLVQPEEVAAVLCFLVTDAASAMSGAAVTVDGGVTTTYDYDLPSSPSAPGHRDRTEGHDDVPVP